MNLLWPMTSQYQSRDDLHATTKNLADEPTLVDGCPIPGQRWLSYHYTKLGRWTYFGWWTPPYQSRDALHTTTHSLADEPTLADAPPQYQSRDALNTTTQNLVDEPTLANGPPVPEQRCLEYQYTKLGRWTYFGWCTPSTKAEMPWIPVHKTWQMNLLWLMHPPSTRAEMHWIPVHKTW